MSNAAVSRKKVPFGDSNASKNFQGVHFPAKPQKFGREQLKQEHE
jgi:hypothetical protein